jgi:hypothetical protein
MPPFLNPLPPDGPRLEKRKSNDLEQREISSNKKQATGAALPSASGSGTKYWMVQWYVFPEACQTIVGRNHVKGGLLSRRNTRHGRGMVSLS